MNILHKAALESLIKNRTRTLVTIIGVILSAAMITAVSTFAVSLQAYMVNGAIEKYGGWHAAFLNADPAFAREQAEDGRVEGTAAFENIGYAALENGKNPDKPYLFLAGFNSDTYAVLPVSLITGHLPENSGEVLVPAHVADNGGVKISVGDTLSLAVGNRSDGKNELNQHDPFAQGEVLVPHGIKTYKVVGICARPAFEQFSAPGYTLITAGGTPDAAKSLSLFVTLKKPGQIHAYTDKMPENRACVLNDDVLRFMGLSDDTMFNMLLYAVGGILTALIMLGSIFLIYNSFTISLSDRTQQLGILLSVGATEKQLINSVLFEGICIGAVGIPAGILFGIPGIGFVLSLVTKNFTNVLYDSVPLSLTVSGPALAIAAAVSLVTILISAYIPARRAARTPIMECIRQTNEVKIDAKAVKTSRLAERICGLAGVLALKNFKRNKKRYRSIVLSLTLSVVLFVSASTFGMYLKQGAEQSVIQSDYDICFYTQDMRESEVFAIYEKLKTAEGVTGSTYQAISTYSCNVRGNCLSDSYRQTAGYTGQEDTVGLSLDIQFLEDGIYDGFLAQLGLSAAEYCGPEGKMIAVAKAQPDISDIFASRSMDFTLTAPGGETEIRTTLVDTYPTDLLPVKPYEVKPYVLLVVAPYRTKPQFAGLSAPEKLGLTFQSDNPARSTAEMQAMLDGAGIAGEYTLYNVYKMFDQNRNILFVVNLFTVVFVVMISLIAVANVFNTISTSIKLRRRELCMLRSVGMSERDFDRMMRFECGLYGLRTMLFGLPVAGLLSWLIWKGLSAGGAEIAYAFPWYSMGASVAGVFFVILITTFYAVRRLKKENIIDALRDEMT